MKNFILTCAISILTISMTFGQSSWYSGTAKLYAYPTTTHVGIGTTTPGAMLHIVEPGTGYSYAFRIHCNGDHNKAINVYDKDDNVVFRIWGNGVVNAKKIYAESFEVRPDAIGIDWFDYVFKPDYKLKPLNEVENFINTNKHLPDIPSEKEINKSGFNLAEMDGLLLKKIEELTLYVIQQQKEIEELKQIINFTIKTD